MSRSPSAGWQAGTGTAPSLDDRSPAAAAISTTAHPPTRRRLRATLREPTRSRCLPSYPECSVPRGVCLLHLLRSPSFFVFFFISLKGGPGWPSDTPWAHTQNPQAGQLVCGLRGCRLCISPALSSVLRCLRLLRRAGWSAVTAPRGDGVK